MNFSGCAARVTIFLLNAYYCMLFSSSVRVRNLGLVSLWLVSGYAHVFILLSVVIVSFPILKVVVNKA